jgi:hypothetical protein
MYKRCACRRPVILEPNCVLDGKSLYFSMSPASISEGRQEISSVIVTFRRSNMGIVVRRFHNNFVIPYCVHFIVQQDLVCEGSMILAHARFIIGHRW